MQINITHLTLCGDYCSETFKAKHFAVSNGIAKDFFETQFDHYLYAKAYFKWTMASYTDKLSNK